MHLHENIKILENKQIKIEMAIIEQSSIDYSVIIFSIIYNLFIIAVFILRAKELYKVEEKIGPIFSLLLVPFLILLLLNILIASDAGRIGTIIPMILYIIFDLWYRQISKQKPKHHPEKMPKVLLLYILLFYFAGMAITGYAFIVSKDYGLIVLTIFMISIVAYFYYQINYNKRKKELIEEI